MARGGSNRTAWRLAALALVAPLVVMVAAMGTHLGLWDWRIGWSLLTWKVGLGLALAGVIAAAACVVGALGGGRGRALAAGIAVVAAGLTAGLYLWAWVGGQTPYHLQAGPADVTSDPADPPAYGGVLSQRRAAAGAPALTASFDVSGCDLAFVPSQAAPEVAAWALDQAGFEVLGSGVGRADGTRTGFWFGFSYDAVVRIRPGRTDVRVSARQDRPDGGEACRLAQAILAEIQARR
ncbi:MAG: DUF1499 domain-containing protein [Brevundimonas sp.]|uniref:DUF1499 domain-containing protein n=1 Tax=Brevundimonas sp. TaxID=1871086 RepID=UPI0025B97DDA|nr:DUF1499 domain-containing protein [Brevundimonas sp.]MBX3477689.1 DUF1499 domain-containing protein [Brevundimonas sp.]